jgi:hypothetical protein
MTFTTVDEAKYFFNTGSKLKFRSSLENGSPTMQNSEWSNLLASAGSQEFTGYWKDEFNYYKLTNTYQTVYTYLASAPYTSNYYKIEAKCNLADNTLGGATQILFKFIWRDDYSRNYIGWNNYIYKESGVDGTLSLVVEEIKAVAPSTEPVVISPSYVLSSISYENVAESVVTYSVVPRVTSINEGQSITFRSFPNFPKFMLLDKNKNKSAKQYIIPSAVTHSPIDWAGGYSPSEGKSLFEYLNNRYKVTIVYKSCLIIIEDCLKINSYKNTRNEPFKTWILFK